MPPLAFLGNLAGGDGLILFIIILLLYGAKKLPDLAKGLGLAVREFTRQWDRETPPEFREERPVAENRSPAFGLGPLLSLLLLYALARWLDL